MDRKQLIFSDQYFYPVNAVSQISFRDITSSYTYMNVSCFIEQHFADIC